MIQRQARGRCPACGESHAACGPAAPVTALDARGEVVDVQDGGPLQVYEVESNGIVLRLRLSETDARKRGLLPEQQTQAQTTVAPAKTRKSTAKNKKRTVEPEASGGE